MEPKYPPLCYLDNNLSKHSEIFVAVMGLTLAEINKAKFHLCGYGTMVEHMPQDGVVAGLIFPYFPLTVESPISGLPRRCMSTVGVTSSQAVLPGAQ